MSLPYLITKAKEQELDNYVQLLSGDDYDLRNGKIFTFAAKLGDFDFMKWLHANGCPWDELTFVDASRHGNIEMLTWMKENNCPYDHRSYIYPLSRGDLDTAKWLYSQGIKPSSFAYEICVEKNNFVALRWLLKIKCPRSIGAFIKAGSGSINMLRFLHHYRMPFSSKAFNFAASVGKLENIVWMRNNGYMWSNDVYKYAAMSQDDNTAVLDYLKKNNCPFHEHAIRENITFGGHIDNFIWLIINGFVVDPYYIIHARRYNCNLKADLLQYYLDLTK